ncbi:VOC family protein [Streptomyces ambofaciens]
MPGRRSSPRGTGRRRDPGGRSPTGRRCSLLPLSVPRGTIGPMDLGAGVLTTDDIHGDYQKLKDRGVEFLQEPQERPYGTEALFRDDSGNWFSFTQPREGGLDTDRDFAC